jgi:hypothetical protein
MSKTRDSKVAASDAVNEPDDNQFKAYDDAVKKGPPLDINVVTTQGGRKLEDELDENTSVNPKLSGGDIDAAWQEAESVGDEAIGGSVSTPDQDNVDEIGEAVGLEFQDNQELRAPAEVLDKRDRQRWELNRSSADSDPANEE